MPDIVKCPNCDSLMVRNKFRDVCENCWKEEEEQYDRVYNFIRKRGNRTATTLQVIEATDIDEQLLLKFIKTGRLKINQFPNLGYACERCGTIIRTGKICDGCTKKLKKELEIHAKEEERMEDLRRREKGVYLANGRKGRD